MEPNRAYFVHASVYCRTLRISDLGWEQCDVRATNKIHTKALLLLALVVAAVVIPT